MSNQTIFYLRSIQNRTRSKDSQTTAFSARTIVAEMRAARETRGLLLVGRSPSTAEPGSMAQDSQLVLVGKS